MIADKQSCSHIMVISRFESRQQNSAEVQYHSQSSSTSFNKTPSETDWRPHSYQCFWFYWANKIQMVNIRLEVQYLPV